MGLVRKCMLGSIDLGGDVEYEVQRAITDVLFVGCECEATHCWRHRRVGVLPGTANYDPEQLVECVGCGGLSRLPFPQDIDTTEGDASE